jgi:NAD(P)-dependent dehydrogenase (short-subunit alcohol dehydrogenase family)
MIENANLLIGKKVIITGAGRGIGKGVAIECVRHGAKVAILDIDEKQVRNVVDELNDMKLGSAIGCTVDVVSEGSVKQSFAQALEKMGGVDGVVINAGVLYLAPITTIELADWDRVIKINLTGSFLCARESARIMKSIGNPGSIVFTSSLFGLRGGAENGVYSASKFGVIGLAQSLAAELGPEGIRVNCVCPGQVQTEMIEKLLLDRSALTGKSIEEIHSDLVARIPSHKMGTIEEIAEPFVFLLSEMSRYVNGHSLVIDGGWQVG